MLKNIYYVLIATLLIINTSCKKDDSENVISPASQQDPDSQISAKVGEFAFNGNEVSQSSKKGLTITAKQGVSSITIGTDFPPAPGSYTLGQRDPFGGKNYFATYVDGENVEYRTKENAGTLIISNVVVENDVVKSMRGNFNFKAVSASGKEITVESGLINVR